MNKIGLALLPHEKEHPSPYDHPESAARLNMIVEHFQGDTAPFEFVQLPVREAAQEDLTRIHDEAYIEQLKAIADTGGGYLDGETFLGEGTFGAVLKVVGVCLEAVDKAVSSEISKSFIVGRPPGHHAEKDRGMGFCLMNNIAVMAAYALDRHHLERVAVVDFDVHHGNGTQNSFYDTDQVFFISTHQYPFYPGTGSAAEKGVGAGEGFTLNFPLAQGTGDDEIISIFKNDIFTALDNYRPQLILVSAGFDAHRIDPLGGLNFTGKAYYEIGSTLKEVADKHCQGRVVTIVEGGYSSEGNYDAAANYLKGLTDQ